MKAIGRLISPFAKTQEERISQTTFFYLDALFLIKALPIAVNFKEKFTKRK